MKELKIETDSELDQTNLAFLLREIADTLLDGDIESCELMDGSYRIETSLGVAFFSIVN